MSEGRHDTSGHKNLKSAHDYRNSLQYLRYEFRFTIVMGKLIEQIDVIAQFKHDGEIIPMRLQILTLPILFHLELAPANLVSKKTITNRNPFLCYSLFILTTYAILLLKYYHLHF